MLLTPLYDTPSFLRFDVPSGDPAVPVLRQRRRFATILGGLDDAQWAAVSRRRSSRDRPDTQFVVEVGERVLVRAGDPPGRALRLTGSAIDLLEGRST